jgi:hypothetical protein
VYCGETAPEVAAIPALYKLRYFRNKERAIRFYRETEPVE